MTAPNLYPYKGKLYTISEVLQEPDCCKSRWQIMWALRKGKTLAEALAIDDKCFAGKVYQHWTVCDLSHRKNSRTYWKIKCNNCGITCVKSTARVNMDLLCSNCNGRTRGETGLRQLYANYKHSAKKRSLDFSLSLEEFSTLTSGACVYCGVLPMKRMQPRKKTEGTDWGDYTWNGVDRIDSQVGYSTDNCLPCCDICNAAKRDIPLSEFMDYLLRLGEYVASGQLTKMFERSNEGQEVGQKAPENGSGA